VASLPFSLSLDPGPGRKSASFFVLPLEKERAGVSPPPFPPPSLLSLPGNEALSSFFFLRRRDGLSTGRAEGAGSLPLLGSTKLRSPFPLPSAEGRLHSPPYRRAGDFFFRPFPSHPHRAGKTGSFFCPFSPCQVRKMSSPSFLLISARNKGKEL